MAEIVAVIGSQNYPNLDEVRAYVRALPRGTVIVVGAWHTKGRIIPCRGVDETAYQTAIEVGLIPVLVVANWKLHGRSAGMRRNPITARIADRIRAFHHANSPGTAHTIECARRLGRPVDTGEDR